MIEAIKYIIIIFLIDQIVSVAIRKTKNPWKKYIFLAIMALIYAGAYEIIINRLPENYFKTFSLNRVFTTDKLKKSYRSLSLKYHPDRNWNPEHQKDKIFEQTQEKYEILSNEYLKVIYDKFGPEKAAIASLEQKKGRNGDYYHNNKQALWIKDGIFYSAFAIILLAISSEENMQVVRKVCYCLIIGFFGLEIVFLWDEQQVYDIFDVIFPSTAIFERIIILRYFVGIICITIKNAVKLKYTGSSALIVEKMEEVASLQNELNGMIKAADAAELSKNLSQNEEFTRKLNKLNILLKDVANYCEENSTEKKRERNIKRKRRIKASLILLVLFMAAYIYVHNNEL